MNLDFLSPLLTDHAPPAESPMLSAARRSGATVEVRDGWQVATGFGDEAAARLALAATVGFADASPVPKIELHGPSEQLFSHAAGLGLGWASAHNGAWWCALTPTRALVIGAQPQPSELEGLQSVDVTTQFCGLRIEGPYARTLMSRFCALDLRPEVAPPGALRPGSVARTPGLVIVEAPDRLLVLVGAALAEYLWTVVSDAAGRLGGMPVGIDQVTGGPVTFARAADSA